MDESGLPIAREHFDAATPEEQRQILGDVIYTKVLPQAPDLACKIVAVFLLALHTEKLMRLVNDDEYLASLVEQAKEKQELLENGPAMPAVIGSSKPRYQTDKAFECGICAYDKEEGEPYVSAAGSPVCKECFLSDLKPQFEAALNDEEDYPVPWAKADLQPSDFPTFDDDFLARWEARVKMYKTPKNERVCCQQLYHDVAGAKKACTSAVYERLRRDDVETGQCLNFLGVAKETKGTILTCPSCDGSSCGTCGFPLDPSGETQEHKCDPSKLGAEPDIDKTLLRGRDFQICPGETCRRYYGLWEGCNAMICTKCRTHFCFICGERAEHDGGHWGANKPCQRWNQPGSRRAMHDEEEVPLVIEPQFPALVAQLRAQAAATRIGPNQRQMLLDQALCQDITGRARAERTREVEIRRRQGFPLMVVMWGLENTGRFEELLLTWLLQNMDFYLSLPERKFVANGRKDRPNFPKMRMVEAKERLRAVRIIRLEICGRVKTLRRNARGVLDEALTVFEMFPELDALVDRWLELSGLYVAELIELAEELLVPEDDYYMFTLPGDLLDLDLDD
ncbi:hypothetical protein B0A55_00406 [Friedmanniomyces simplex]|uniref:RING-type domain-containing protein n=1 Tax=Friedmanniomyces simplex TaxID=329884 RepID=A0A4U0Y4Y7_9PEZI|nr:hypothetical protein B0A55_00406 [Friedmanniomyces simplex]